MEEWRIIEGFEDYQVSSLGRVRSFRRGTEKILSCCANKEGYRYFNVYKNAIRKTLRVSRVLALAFIPNPDNKPEVDHINRNPSDDRLGNLRWATRSEQQINTKDRDHSTDFRNICLRYCVKIVRNNKTVSKSFTSLDEAVKWRNNMLDISI